MADGNQQDKPIRLFYSYSHRDEAFRLELQTHLSFLRRNRLITDWHDRMIGAGDDWKNEIDRNLASADIILLLVSADFIDSDYCWGEEMAKALARHQLGEARIVPVILRPCRWQSTPLACLQAVPKDGKPVNEWLNRDAAFDDIAGAIELTIAGLLQQRRHAAELAQAEEARRVEEQRRLVLRHQREQKEREHSEALVRQQEEIRQRLATELTRQRAEEQRQLGLRREREARERAEVEARRAAEERQQEARRQQEETRQGAALEAARTAETTRDDHDRKGQRLTAVARFVIVAAVVGTLAWQILPSARESEQRTESSPTQPPALTSTEAALKPLQTFSDCDECPQMVVIPGGSFLMGSPADEAERIADEGPQHRVTIKPFALGKTEVTFAEWDACVTAGSCKGYRPSDQGWGRGKRPVINVSWAAAQAYVGWLSRQTGKPYRLPTEAEWEYAARAGSITRYAFGDDITPKDANYDDSKLGRTSEVEAYPPNAWGIYDMHGNVWEWVQDVWHDSYEGAPVDGSAWTDGDGLNSYSLRVIRGGSWVINSKYLRSAYRGRRDPYGYGSVLGFRVARTRD